MLFKPKFSFSNVISLIFTEAVTLDFLSISDNVVTTDASPS